MLELKNISKKFKEKLVIDNLSVKFPSKGLVVINGKSGSGKTTLLNIIALEDKNFDGEILYNGTLINFKSLNFKQNNIFYNRYEDNLVLSLSVNENLKLFLNEHQYQNALNYVEKYELTYLLTTKTQNISSGEYQKICLILALARKAPITLLDEPVGNIDANSIKQFYDDLKEMAKEVLIIYVSHYEEDIDYLSDYIYTYENNNLSLVKEGEFNDSIINNEKLKLNLSNFFKNSRLWNKSISKLRHILFFIVFYIFFICLFLNIYLLSLTKYNYFDYEIKNAPIDIFYLDEKINTNFDCIQNIEIKDMENYLYYTSTLVDDIYKQTFSNSIFFNDFIISFKYMGIANEFVLKNKQYNLEIDEIIITDYLADELGCKTNDVINLFNDELIVKEIIDTGYIEYTNNPEYLSLYDYYYNIIYVSNDLIENKEIENANRLFNTDTKIYNSKVNVYKYNDDIIYKNNNPLSLTFNIFPVDPLTDTGFYCGLDYFSVMFEKIPGYYEDDINSSFEYLKSCIGKSYKVEFELGEYKFSKELVYMGPINYVTGIVLSEEQYDYIKEEVGFDKLNYSYKTVINGKKITSLSSYNDFIKTLETRDSYNFVNKEQFDNLYNIFLNKNEFLIKTLVLEIIIIVLLGFIYYFAIYKNEYKNYRKLQNKGYSLKYYYAINYTYRLIIHLIILSVLLIGFIFLMKTII